MRENSTQRGYSGAAVLADVCAVVRRLGDKLRHHGKRFSKKQHELMDAWATFCTSPPIAEG